MRRLFPLIIFLLLWQPVTKDAAGNPVTISGYHIYCAPTSVGPFTTLTATVTTTYYFSATTGPQYCQVTSFTTTNESPHSITSTEVTIGLPQ